MPKYIKSAWFCILARLL